MQAWIFTNALADPEAPAAPTGGVERAAWALSRALADAGDDVAVVAGGPPECSRRDGRWRVLYTRPTLRVAQTAIPARLGSRAAVPSERPDVILALMGNQPAPWAAARHARRLGVPLVVWHHGRWLGGGSLARRLLVGLHERRLGPSALRQAARVIVLSEAARRGDPMLDGMQGKTAIVPNGVDAQPSAPAQRAAVRARLGIPDGAPAIAFVGTLSEAKGIPVLLAAFAALPASLEAHLVVLGDGPLRSAVRDAARPLPQPRRIHALGHVANGHRAILAACDLLCLPSRNEAYPLSVLEAQAAGLPVVASDLPALREMVRHGADGVLVAPGDEAALAQALAELLRDPARRAALGAAALLRVRGQTWESVAAQARRVLAAAASEAPGAPGPIH